MLSKKLIHELIVILKDDYDVQLSDEEAENLGNSLVDYFEILLKVDQDEYEHY